MLFMVEQRLLHEDQYPLLSCFDIAVLLCYLLPHRAQPNTVLHINAGKETET